MKKVKKSLALLAALLLVLALAPAAVQAETESYVYVTVMNETYDEGAWTGTLFQTAVVLEPGMTLGDAVKAACDAEGVSVTGATAAEGGFITDIDGLSMGAAGGWSGWMFTVNNWFNTTGLSAAAEANDFIAVQFSVDGMGADLGSIFDPAQGANNKTLQAIIGDGILDPAFDPATHEYTLSVPYGTESITLLPVAFNLNYQVRTQVGDATYKWIEPVPVVDGTVITITCGDPSWPSMNNGSWGTGGENVPAEVYTLTVAYEEEVIDDGGNGGGTVDDGEVTAELDNTANTGDSGASNLLLVGAMAFSLAGIAFALTARRRRQE